MTHYIKLIIIIICCTVTTVYSEQQKSLHYVFLSIPSLGHIKPTLELVRMLKAKGHTVFYFSTNKYKSIVEDAGAIFIQYNSKEVEKLGGPFKTQYTNIKKLYENLHAISKDLIPEINQFIAANKVDKIIYDQFAIWGALALKQNITSICSSTMILEGIDTWLDPAEATYDKDKHEQIFSYSEMRDLLKCKNADKIISFFPIDLNPSLASNKNVLHVNYRNFSYKPSNAIFSDNALIYLSLGTVFNDNIELFALILNILAKTTYEVVVSTGGNEKLYNQLKKLNLNNIKVYNFVNQEEILSDAALFITHGGANSVTESINFEVPMIFLPQIKEQYYNSNILQNLGVGYLVKPENYNHDEFKKIFKNMKHEWAQYKQNIILLKKKWYGQANILDIID